MNDTPRNTVTLNEKKPSPRETPMSLSERMQRKSRVEECGIFYQRVLTTTMIREADFIRGSDPKDKVGPCK